MKNRTMALALVVSSFCLTIGSVLAAIKEESACFPRLDAELVAAVPFTLAQPYRSPWRSDHPMVASGFVVVIRSDGGLIQSHAVPDPNLYAGDEIVEIVYRNPEAGVVAGVLRSRKSLDGLDLFWGSPKYAESIDLDNVASERRRAVGLGLKPLPSTTVHRALSFGKTGKRLANRGTLYDFASEIGATIAATRP